MEKRGEEERMHTKKETKGKLTVEKSKGDIANYSKCCNFATNGSYFISTISMYK